MSDDPVTLEWDLTPIPDPPSDDRCAFCGRPSNLDVHQLGNAVVTLSTTAPPASDPVAVEAGYQPPTDAGPPTPCCENHRRPMCSTCRETPGAGNHRDPAQISKRPS